MQSTDLSGVAWRKSSRSTGGAGDQTDCVEVAELPGRVAMRDSKDPAGPVLALTRAGWQAFLNDVHTGTFN
jgi:hypothetical protein